MITPKLKLSSNSLVITVFISLILGVICSMLVLLLYTKLQSQSIFSTKIKLQRNLKSAINIVLADTVVPVLEQTNTLDLFDKGEDSAIIKTENWGLFSIASITVKANKKSKTKTFFYGQTMNQELSSSLYLTEHQTSLSISGHAKLAGDAFLPKGGLKPVFIDQRGFLYNELIKGEIKTSYDNLPEIKTGICQNLNGLLKKNIITSNGNVNRDIPDSINQSFCDSVLIIYQKSNLTLSNCKLRGHVMILSDSAIIVHNDCFLENVILAAPSIQFDEGFTGTVQAISSDSIIAKKNCHFNYPSCLILLKNTITELQPKIIIGDYCGLSGVILTVSKTKDISKTYTEIGLNSVIKGFVYSSGYLSVKGRVYGTILTDYFIYKSSPSVYINYLVDAELNRNALSRFFIAPHIFRNCCENKIAQWVN